MKYKQKYHFHILLWIYGTILLLISFISCKPDYTPKPDAYYRIEIPAPEYQIADIDLPVSFETSVYTQIIQDSIHKNSNWFNILYPAYKATLYCSFEKVRNKKELIKILQENKELVYRHTVRADAIEAKEYEAPDSKLFATLYHLTGNSATPLQFVVTDSSNYMLRGALYFDNQVKNDSVAPVVDYITQDVVHLIESINKN
ncbi:hypothetical protein [Coprobacter tertius]|uniref:Gliding motility-associated lipoprotein GldD n=1 Tax=Coprobacter tertius TaxID=2944915 RepID=A0ABT1MNM4_9BACT|nr:hypothetical protein [Coprobacter tertius]MCP9612891.1 hypothetical protein [Coprobacter tertius]